MHWHYLGRRQRLWHAQNKQSPFISAWDKVSASILSRFADGFSGSSSVTESEETLSRPEVLLYPYLYASVKVCRSLWPYIGLLWKQHASGAAWSKVMREFLQELMSNRIPKFWKSDLDAIHEGREFHMECFLLFGTFSVMTHSFLWLMPVFFFFSSKIWRECHSEWTERLWALFKGSLGTKVVFDLPGLH